MQTAIDPCPFVYYVGPAQGVYRYMCVVVPVHMYMEKMKLEWRHFAGRKKRNLFQLTYKE